MTDDDLISAATGMREGILDGKSSEMACFMVATPLQGWLSFQGIETELVEADLGDINHCWLELPDGRVLDPTADQFNGMDENPGEPLPPVYLGPPTIIHPLKVIEGGKP